jgi:hypothetical protein
MSERIDEARRVARALLDDLEGQNLPIDTALMRAKRLARLMRDADAQYWLDLEMRGYPAGFSSHALGTCKQYAISGGRLIAADSQYYVSSLPELEAKLSSDGALIESLRTTRNPGAIAKDFLEKNATEALMATELKVFQNRRDAYAKSKGLFISLKSAIHSYATDTYLAIELGDVAQDIFEAARKEVDAFVRAYCPKAAEKLVAINERMGDRSSESRTAALTSCRRLLLDVADSLFPPRDEEWTGPSGIRRKVGAEQYKNRLLAYVVESTHSQSSYEIIESELDHLASRLDAIYDKTSKGVHVEVSEQEARLAVIQTYLFVGEIVRRVPAGDTESS